MIQGAVLCEHRRKSMHRCPENHNSTTADFCSVCGIEIAATMQCPDCTTPRSRPEQVVCEVCGYNFHTGASVVPPLASVATAPGQGRWDLIATVDAVLYGKPNPQAPVGQPPQQFTLYATENLIGRGGTEVRVQIPIYNDVGVSRRQALLLCKPDGTLLLRDVGSANGTQLNGVDIIPGVDTPVKDGDVIAVGAWTRILVQYVT
jgi:hypothetical protein